MEPIVVWSGKDSLYVHEQEHKRIETCSRCRRKIIDFCGACEASDRQTKAIERAKARERQRGREVVRAWKKMKAAAAKERKEKRFLTSEGRK